MHSAAFRPANPASKPLRELAMVPAFVDVVGVALATKPVYVNGQMASRKGEYFCRELSVNNAGGPVWLEVTVTFPA